MTKDFFTMKYLGEIEGKSVYFAPEMEKVVLFTSTGSVMGLKDCRKVRRNRQSRNKTKCIIARGEDYKKSCYSVFEELTDLMLTRKFVNTIETYDAYLIKAMKLKEDDNDGH